MSLAVVSEITRRFRAAVAKWQPDPTEPLECHFLLREGYYIGHRLTWGAYRGVWFSEPGEMKIYRGEQWLLTLPVLLSELESVAMSTEANHATVTSATTPQATRSAA